MEQDPYLGQPLLIAGTVAGRRGAGVCVCGGGGGSVIIASTPTPRPHNFIGWFQSGSLLSPQSLTLTLARAAQKSVD